jgi:tetratricopeptide (TPR) repeat protein
VTRRTVVAASSLVVLAGAAVIWQLAVPASGAGPLLTLRVSSGTTDTVNRGTPLLFEVVLTGRRDGVIRVGGIFRSWDRLISLQTEEGAALGHVAPLRARWSRVRGGPAGYQIQSGQSPTAIVSRDRVHTLLLEGAPDATAAMPAGSYRIRAILGAPFWMLGRWRGTVRSQPVAIDLRSADPALEARRLADVAAFHLRHGRFRDAQPLATELLKLRPTAAGPLILAGDVDAGLGLWSEALSRYREALALSPRTREEPDALLDRISQAHRHLGQPTTRR